jgi:predicted ATPase
MPPGFVGRARELAVLMESVGSARAGQPQFVLVEGEGGFGKTSLLRAFQESLSGASLAVASGDEAEAGLQYGVLDEFARQLGQAGQSAAWQLSDRQDPFAMGAAFLRVLGRASRSPLVLTLDDAHLADGASMAALTFAARRLQADPIVVVLAARDEGVVQLPPGLLRLIQHRGTRMALAGL